MSKATTTARRRAILLVEDHPVYRFGLAGVVSSGMPGYDIVEAGSLAEALAALQRRPFTLASFDIGLPDLKSPNELAVIRRRWPSTRLVILSGCERREQILAALEAGVHGYLLKSMPLERVVQQLEKVIEGDIVVPRTLADLPVEPQPATDPAPADRTAPRLTERQRQMLQGLVDGQSNKAMAKDLGIAASTVKLHLAGLYRAIGVGNRVQAAAAGRQILSMGLSMGRSDDPHAQAPDDDLWLP